MSIRIETLTGAQILPLKQGLAELRIQTFREYPYLYNGNLAYEQQYLNGYANSKQKLLVAVLDDDKLVGASTAMPLLQAEPEFIEPFKQIELDLTSIFYFGESVLLPAYRGKGFGKRFCRARSVC